MTKHALQIFSFLVILLCAAVYGLGLHNELVFDDARLTDGGLFAIYGSLWPIKQRLLSNGTFVWIHQLVGENYPVQRMVNLAWHFATSFVVYQLMRALLPHIRDDHPESRDHQTVLPSQQAALAVGMVFFVLSPVAVYAVGYLIQRSIVMATFFAALAAWGFVRAISSDRLQWGFVALSIGSYLLAVLSKEQSFLIAAWAVPLYIFIKRPSWKKSLTIVAVAAVLLAVSLAFLLKLYPNLVGQVFDETSRQLAEELDRQRPGVKAQIYPLSILNQAGLFFYYGLFWIMPHVGWMSIDMRPPFPLTMTAMPHLLGAVAYVALWVLAVWALIRRSNQWGFLGLCALLPLMLFSTEFATVWVQDPMPLYRSYLWAITLPGVVTIMLTGWSPRVLLVLGGTLAVLWAALAAERVLSFENELSVWNDAIQKNDPKGPANAVGRYRAYLNRGAYHLARFSPEPAVADFRTAIALGEPSGAAWLNIGMAQQLTKKYDEALQSYDHAEAAGYKDAPLYFQRGETLFAQSKFAAAADSYGRALAFPQSAEVTEQTHQRRAESYLRIERYAEAAADFEALVKTHPHNARHLTGLGMAYVGAQDGARALDAFERALRSERNALGLYGRALAHATLGKNKEALQDLDDALKLEPHNGAYQNLRQAWAQGVRPPMASGSP